MTNGALSVMLAAKAEIDAAGAANHYHYTGGAWVREFGDRLAAFEPFRTIANSWVRNAGGGGVSGAYLSGQAVWHRLLGDIDPVALLAAISEQVAANRYTAFEVRPIRGLTVAAKHKLTDDASIWPNEDLPPSKWASLAFAHPMLGTDVPTNTAALVQQIVVEPALLPAVPESGKDLGDGERRAARDAFTDRVRLALGLATDGAIEIPLVYVAADRPCIFGDGAGVSQKPTLNYHGTNREVDIDEVRRFLDQLEAMKDGRALEFSIDRMIRSRHAKSLEDRIIDLGMAAEIALMHIAGGDKDGGKGEITNKITSRGAWLLGQNVEERLEIAAILSELYTARSRVVHTGEADEKLHARAAVFDSLAGSIARTLLARGQFPNWKHLVLGGDARQHR